MTTATETDIPVSLLETYFAGMMENSYLKRVHTELELLLNRYFDEADSCKKETLANEIRKAWCYSNMTVGRNSYYRLRCPACGHPHSRGEWDSYTLTYTPVYSVIRCNKCREHIVTHMDRASFEDENLPIERYVMSINAHLEHASDSAESETVKEWLKILAKLKLPKNELLMSMISDLEYSSGSIHKNVTKPRISDNKLTLLKCRSVCYQAGILFLCEDGSCSKLDRQEIVNQNLIFTFDIGTGELIKPCFRNPNLFESVPYGLGVFRL